MAYLIDTSILVRLANTADVQYRTAARAMFLLHERGEVLYVAPQNLVEFRNVATRPLSNNGLGLSAISAESKSEELENQLGLLPETAEIFQRWKAIVDSLGTKGKQVHDARLVAVCHVHGVSNILTFNLPHFTTLSTFAPGIAVVDPATIGA